MTKVTPDFCYRLNGRGGAARIDIDDLTPKTPGSLWIHIDYKDEENQELIKKMKLDKSITENLLDPDTSPAIILIKMAF